MIQQIINGIANKLDDAFDAAIFTDPIDQGLQEPCFLIKELNLSQKTIIKNRKFRNIPFDLHYFQETNEARTVAEQLFDVVEIITLANGDKLRGTEMKYEMIDGVLHFFINFNLFVITETEEVEVMEELELQGGING